MIRGVRANRASFRAVEFSPGMNVVLADRTVESDQRDSRNGLGKSTLVEIIHFCLAASARPKQGLRSEPLAGWEFTLDLRLGGRDISVTRTVDKPTTVVVHGEVAGLDGEPAEGGGRRFSLSEWSTALGDCMFGLGEDLVAEKWSPTFRSLIGYFARRGGGFSTPFQHYPRQAEWDKQVNNAFLLGLAWEDAQSWQELKEQEKALQAVKKAAAAGLVEGLIGTVGELEAEKVQLHEEVEAQAERLRTFRVHSDYRDIEARASELTRSIHDFNNANIADRRRLDYFRSAIGEPDEPDSEDVVRLYEAAGIELPGAAVKRLEDVQDFHKRLVANRRDFLHQQIDDIEAAIADRSDQVENLTDRRAELLEILRSHGALDEYTSLQKRHVDLVTRVREVENSLANLRKFEAGRSALKIDRERLHQRATRDYEERFESRERAIRLFNAHSKGLYEAPGRLVVDITDNGFSFGVEIERAGSAGIDKMKALCYDLTIAELWAAQASGPGFLIHDSTIFEGVDERQVALALLRAAEVSQQAGFQYLCLMNSDAIPTGEFPKGFSLTDYLKLRLTDDSHEGSLLGMRF